MKTLTSMQTHRAFVLFDLEFASQLLFEIGQAQQKQITGRLTASDMAPQALRTPIQLGSGLNWEINFVGDNLVVS